MPETEEEPQHWPTERMINEGHPDHATPGDLEGLDEAALFNVADICRVSEMAPDECIPCLAYAMVIEKMEGAEDEEVVPDGSHFNEVPEFVPDDVEAEVEGLAKLDNLMSIVPPWTESDVTEEPVSVADVFADKVAELSVLVEEMLNGPPIPPKDVSLADLALLTLAADKWIKMSEIQGGLAETQQQMLDATRALVARLRS